MLFVKGANTNAISMENVNFTTVVINADATTATAVMEEATVCVSKTKQSNIFF